MKIHCGEKLNKCNLTLHPFMHIFWGHIWKCTVEKSQTNATSVTLHPFMYMFCGHILKCTVDKSQTNATSVTLNPFMHMFWGHILKCTVDKSQTNAASVTMPLLGQLPNTLHILSQQLVWIANQCIIFIPHWNFFEGKKPQNYKWKWMCLQLRFMWFMWRTWWWPI